MKYDCGINMEEIKMKLKKIIIWTYIAGVISGIGATLFSLYKSGIFN